MSIVDRSRTCRGVYETRPDCPAHYHDTPSASRRAGCTCPLAKERRRIYNKRQKHGRLNPAMVDPTGTRRRMQALARIGWSLREQVRQLGWTGTPGHIMWGSRSIHRDTAAAVAALYDRLWNVPGPSSKARLAAERRNWPSPLAWDDDTIDAPDAQPQLDAPIRPKTAVEPANVTGAITGDIPAGELTLAEKTEAVRYLLRLGWSHEQIGVHLCWSSTPDTSRQAVTAFCDRHDVATHRHTREAVAAA